VRHHFVVLLVGAVSAVSLPCDGFARPIVQAAAAITEANEDAQSEDAQPTGKRRRPGKTSSPLHDFLGIDAETGRFQPAERTTVEADQESRPDDSSTGKASSSGKSPSGKRDVDAATSTNEAFRRAAESIHEGAIPGLAELLDGSTSSHPLFRLHRQIVWVTTAVLMVYPIGIVLAELATFLTGRKRVGFTELDRRHQRTRLRRRLSLAGVLAVLILTIGLGGANGYWWNQPTAMAFFGAAVLALGSAAVVLANLIRGASRTYQLDLIREIRRDQLELRSDLEELRRHLTHHASS